MSLSISDDGRGFDPERTSPYQMGLGIMGERALAVGADLDISSTPGQGTEIVVVWQDPGDSRRLTMDERRMMGQSTDGD